MANWLGVKEFDTAITGVIARADSAAKKIVADSAALIEAAAKNNFEGSHKKGEPHQGGSSPNVVTGTLRRSIRHDPVRKIGLGTYGTTVGPSTAYGRRVELGFNGSAAYPYFGPAVEKNIARLQDIAFKTWRDAVAGG